MDSLQNTSVTKRILVSVILGTAIIGGALLINYYSGNKSAPNNTGTSATQTLTTTQETQEGTIQLPTTALGTTTKMALAENSTTTLTDILADQTLGKYIKLNKTGDYTQQTKEQIINSATKSILELDYKPITADKIHTLDTSTKQDALDYKNKMYLAIAPLFDLKEYELTIYARAIQNNSADDFAKLAKIAKIYDSVAQNVLNIKPPKDASKIHVDIINSLFKFAIILKELSHGYDDPAMSLSGTANFSKAETDIKVAFGKLKTYFELKNINKYE